MSCLANVTHTLHDSLKQQGKASVNAFSGKSSVCTCAHMNKCTFVFLPVYVCIADPEEVDPTLLQFCSSQLKLLQLYSDIQQLHTAADTGLCSTKVSRHACRTPVRVHLCEQTNVEFVSQ